MIERVLRFISRFPQLDDEFIKEVNEEYDVFEADDFLVDSNEGEFK
ncbi:hypothetical protein [Aquibacillus rhizosphaerae]|uniref:YozD family protein n=1 Tax=Aquibacillus rhizosphaerae TaxID=3051431 RepID=A0ABT7KZK5_9BACI|nr:hypothetical protein [Aquibacillus sp. LR5S19]MDL4838905.1 hypothetical protein [Aquibacillus sp. LR5S19]